MEKSPSKEALEAGRQCENFFGNTKAQYRKLAAIIDRHFEPLRQRADAWIKVFDALEKTSCFVSASKGIDCALQTIDKLVERAEQAEEMNRGLSLRCSDIALERDAAQARVKELEAERNGALETLESVRSQYSAFRAANAGLVGALRDAHKSAKAAPELNACNYDHDQVCELNTAMCEVFSVLDAALTRLAAGEPAKHPDTERVIERYSIETIRHAANAIFNKLTEAYSCGSNTEQGKQALFDAQRLADIIISSPGSSAVIDAARKDERRAPESP